MTPTELRQLWIAECDTAESYLGTSQEGANDVAVSDAYHAYNDANAKFTTELGRVESDLAEFTRALFNASHEDERRCYADRCASLRKRETALRSAIG